MNIKLTTDQESDILSYITDSLTTYESQMELYREQNLDIYEALSTFTEPNTGGNLPRFKINLMHIILRQVVPRIIAQAPRPTVTTRTDVFFEGEENATGAQRVAMLERNNKFAQAMQDYLTTVFHKDHMRERLKYWVINQLTYGEGFAEVVTKYKVQRSKSKTTKGQKVTEKVIEAMPSLDIISWAEIFYDPRFKMMEDMPGIFRVKEGVRFRDVKFATDEDGDDRYFNIDKLEELGNTKYSGSAQYKEAIYAITGVESVEVESGINKNALNLQTFYGLYSLTNEAEDERMYEITTINKALVIGFREILEMPILDIKGHEDPEVYKSVGLLAPVMGIQSEINYQKNSRATAVSKSLNRDYLWAADSGIDPSQLVGGKGGTIVYAANGLAQAKAGMEEIADRPLDNSYFSDINDLNRDAQRLSHTTDVTQPQGQTAETNTATGAKISFFESNSVIAELRKNFEGGVQELGHKILQWTFDNIEKDITLKRIDDGKFFRLNKEAFRDSLERYDIKIEANSSSFDDVETRRADAIALKNIGLEAAQAGVPIDLPETFKKILGTFENIDPNDFIKEQEITAESLGGIPQGGEQTTPGKPNEAANIVEQVVGGGITEGL